MTSEIFCNENLFFDVASASSHRVNAYCSLEGVQVPKNMLIKLSKT